MPLQTKHFSMTTHTLPTQHIRGYYRSTTRETDVLRIAVKQYTPLHSTPRDGDITIIAAHANGVGKELYEPLWDDLYERSTEGGAGFAIRGIWIADVAFQGESGVLNEELLGNEQSWFDHPRDLLHLINSFRTEMPPPLFGLGHSMGGNNIANLSLIHPRLFTGVILVDPVVQPAMNWSGNHQPALMSAFRRDVWPSRADAEAAFKRNPFYKAWDPRVLELYLKHDLRDLPTLLYPELPAATGAGPVSTASPSSTPVTLRTTKHQEVVGFQREKFPLDQQASAEALAKYKPPHRIFPDIPVEFNDAGVYRPEAIMTYHNLPHLRPHALYVFPTESTLYTPETRQKIVNATGTAVSGNGGQTVEGAVQHVFVEKAGHFAPFERTTDVASKIASWLGPQTQRWRQESESDRTAWQAEQARDGGRGRMTMSPEYLHWLKWMKDTARARTTKM